jgi:hypothetical protein
VTSIRATPSTLNSTRYGVRACLTALVASSEATNTTMSRQLGVTPPRCTTTI